MPAAPQALFLRSAAPAPPRSPLTPRPSTPQQNRGIGRDLALLYEAYATFLELKAAYARAELVYEEGLNRWGGLGVGACV